MTDLEVIEAFKNQISWSDETTIIEVELTDGQKKAALDSGILIQFPVHWKDFDALSEDREIREFCFKPSTYLGFIIWGEPSPVEVERIFMSRKFFLSAVDIAFIDTKARVWDNKLKTKAFSGLDWQRTLENVTRDGVDAKPFWEWD